MSLEIFVNTGLSDQEYNTSGSEFTEFSVGNDALIFTAGSNVVKDGEPVPSQSDLIQAGVILSGAEQIVPLYLLQDISANELKEIHLMGNQDKRYIVAFNFLSATASEPVFELWDDSDLDTIDGVTLGAGTPSSSWWRGITTTDGLPGSNWTGSRLAGSGSGFFLELNDGNGPLSGADTLYCQLKIVIPASATVGGSAVPVFVVKYTSN